MSVFSGLPNVYGSYTPATGKHWQVKGQVTRKVVYRHLKGLQPYGFYPLDDDKTRLGVADFDNDDPEKALEFIHRTKHYGIDAYLERSKKKGYHAWLFLSPHGVPAYKIHLVIQHILEDIDAPATEVFPKQDVLTGQDNFGNFINAPLFGKRVPEGRTVFLKPHLPLAPYPNQWNVLQRIKRVSEETLDTIIDINDLKSKAGDREDHRNEISRRSVPGYGLPACIRTLLRQGVTFDQRVACFRIAVHLKRIGLPQDAVESLLMTWRFRNQPKPPRQILRADEVKEQVTWAFKKDYRGYGCQEAVIQHVCDATCPILHNPRWNKKL